MAKVFTLTPTSYEVNGVKTTTSKNPIEIAWMQSAPGDLILLTPGNYKRITLKKSARPKGSDRVSIISEVPYEATILRDLVVGSTDAIYISSGVRDVNFSGLKIQVDDRAGIKTVGPGGASAISFLDCIIYGDFDGYIVGSKDVSKWGGHHYYTKNIVVANCEYRGIFHEHSDYYHGVQGNHYFEGNTFLHLGRSRIQVVNRKTENGHLEPIGFGDFVIKDEIITDSNINDGGCTFSFMGGMPTSNVMLENVTTRLGCDSALASDLRNNISGIFVMQNAGPSAPGAGDEAHDGGTKTLTWKDCTFEVGLVYPGKGSFVRDALTVGAVENFTMIGGVYRQATSRNRALLDINTSCLNFKVLRDPDIFEGTINYKGTLYKSWDLFIVSHPEVKL